MGSAIRDWERDLEFLYYEYYVGKFGSRGLSPVCSDRVQFDLEFIAWSS